MWLITGGNGQLGRCLQDVLSSRDIPFQAFPSAELDITSAEQAAQVFSRVRPSVVVNAAAYTAVDKAESEPEKAMAVNADGPANLARLAKHYDARLIHVSTDYVFAGTAVTAYAETAAVDPQSVYGATKLAGEQAVLAYDKAAVIRTAWVFSEYGNNFVKTMLRLAGDRDALGVVADQFGCPTYAGDIAQAIVALVSKWEQGRVQPGVFHYAGDVAVNWWSFARHVHQTAWSLGLLERIPELSMLTTDQYPTPARRPANSVLDCQALNRLGIASSDWRQAVRTVLQRL